jgi:hypothetical protein
MFMTIKPTTSATAEPEQPAITTSQYLQETVENRRTERRGVLAAGLTLVGAAIAWFAGRANAGHDTNIAYDSQTAMHLDVTNTTSGSTRVSSNISGTAAFVVLNNYPVGISRPDGLLGRTTYTTSNCAGVAGASEAASGGIGVLGTSNASNGTGVFGYSGSSVPFIPPPAGTGVFGEGPVNGIAGKSAAGTAVMGNSSTGDGVWGITSGNLRIAVGAHGIGQAHALAGYSENQVGVIGVNVSGANYAGYFTSGGPTHPGVFIDGFFVATGTKSQAVPTAKHGLRRLYAVESTQPLFEDFGSAWLENGQTTVRLDPIFAATVNTATKYHVFLTPRSADTRGLAVVAQNAEGFTVQEAHGGRGSYEFDYRIMAKVRGQEDTRLEAFTLPTSPTPPKVPSLGDRLSEEVATSVPRSALAAPVGPVPSKDR